MGLGLPHLQECFLLVPVKLHQCKHTGNESKLHYSLAVSNALIIWAFGVTGMLLMLLLKVYARNIYLDPDLKNLLLGWSFCFSFADVTWYFWTSSLAGSQAQGFPVGMPRPSLQAELGSLCAVTWDVLFLFADPLNPPEGLCEDRCQYGCSSHGLRCPWPLCLPATAPQNQGTSASVSTSQYLYLVCSAIAQR